MNLKIFWAARLAYVMATQQLMLFAFEQIENRKSSPRYKWNDLCKEYFIRKFMTKLYACFDSIMHYAERDVNQAVRTIIEVY